MLASKQTRIKAGNLTVSDRGQGSYVVEGGYEPNVDTGYHGVAVRDDRYACDCLASQTFALGCSHGLAVARHLGRDLQPAAYADIGVSRDTLRPKTAHWDPERPYRLIVTGATWSQLPGCSSRHLGGRIRCAEASEYLARAIEPLGIVGVTADAVRARIPAAEAAASEYREQRDAERDAAALRSVQIAQSTKTTARLQFNYHQGLVDLMHEVSPGARWDSGWRQWVVPIDELPAVREGFAYVGADVSRIDAFLAEANAEPAVK